MKIVLILAASAIALISSGCASVPKATPTVYDDNIDSARVAAIESVAKTQGVTVVWVHYPTRKSTATSVAPVPAATGT